MEKQKKMSLKQLMARLTRLRTETYKKEGSYEDSYTYVMEGLDNIIYDLRAGILGVKE